jgi:hypothetical protein
MIDAIAAGGGNAHGMDTAMQAREIADPPLNM